MGQVKISTLCRQGSVLETLFVPPRQKRFRPVHRWNVWDLVCTYRKTERFVNLTQAIPLPAPGCAGTNRV